jgi:hypothetical protein
MFRAVCAEAPESVLPLPPSQKTSVKSRETNQLLGPGYTKQPPMKRACRTLEGTFHGEASFKDANRNQVNANELPCLRTWNRMLDNAGPSYVSADCTVNR